MYVDRKTREIRFSDFMTWDEWVATGGGFFFRVCGVDRDGFEGPWSFTRLFTKTAPNRILVYGDSIAGGYGSSEWDDYEPDLPWGFNLAGCALDLDDMLRGRYWPEAYVVLDWISGGQTWEGLDWVHNALTYWGPEYLVYAFGIVDIVDPAGCLEEPCRTLSNLREIGAAAFEYNCTPICCTILPPNPNGHFASAYDGVKEMNKEIRDMIEENEGFYLADLYYAIYRGGGFAQMFFDSLHPNDTGHMRLAGELFDVLSEILDEQ